MRVLVSLGYLLQSQWQGVCTFSLENIYQLSSKTVVVIHTTISRVQSIFTHTHTYIYIHTLATSEWKQYLKILSVWCLQNCILSWFLLAFLHQLVKLNFPWYSYWPFALCLLGFSSLYPLLILLLSISYHFVVFFICMFIIHCMPYVLRGFSCLSRFYHPSTKEEWLFRQWFWIKIFPGLWGFVAPEIRAFNANALGDMNASYHKINASKNLPEVR